MPHIIPVQPDGTLAFEDIEHAIRGNNIHFPRTRLVAIENTQGTPGGLPLSPQYMLDIADLAHKHGLVLHVDGARIFNASTHFNVPVADMVTDADSVTFCLSKGLCAPVGSIIVGSKGFIAEARRVRKVLGGGMRQVGVLAAAGLIALHDMSKRLQVDHDNAHYLAESLSEVPGVDVMSSATNFVFFLLKEDAKLSPAEFVTEMKSRKIILSPYPGFERKFRCVMHYWIDRERIDTVVNNMKAILS